MIMTLVAIFVERISEYYRQGKIQFSIELREYHGCRTPPSVPSGEQQTKGQGSPEKSHLATPCDIPNVLYVFAIFALNEYWHRILLKSRLPWKATRVSVKIFIRRAFFSFLSQYACRQTVVPNIQGYLRGTRMFFPS